MLSNRFLEKKPIADNQLIKLVKKSFDIQQEFLLQVDVKV